MAQESVRIAAGQPAGRRLTSTPSHLRDLGDDRRAHRRTYSPEGDLNEQ